MSTPDIRGWRADVLERETTGALPAWWLPGKAALLLVLAGAVLGPLAGALPKGAVVLASAAFFGMAHSYGAPSGPIGVVMSGVLGWFMALAMFETRGFLAPWIIHFLQDVVIFSTIALLGGP